MYLSYHPPHTIRLNDMGGRHTKKGVVPHNPVYDTTPLGSSLRYVAVSDKHLGTVTVRSDFQTVQSGISESAVYNHRLSLG